MWLYLSSPLVPCPMTPHDGLTGEASGDSIRRDTSGVSPRQRLRQAVDSLCGAGGDWRLSGGDSGKHSGTWGARDPPVCMP